MLHSVLAAAACFALWRLWCRWFGRGDARAALVAGVGLVARAAAGEALFWTSYLRLPIARPLQLGGGLWFFAVDGAGYMAYAESLARRGAMATLTIDAHYPSRAYVQILTAFVAAFGDVASVALLLNCAAYLATCALLVRLRPRVDGAVLFALAAIAFGPATLVWSLQPLKDTFFQLLVAALVVACARWQERPGAAPAAAMVALTFLLSSIRWYFGVIAWCALAPFFALTSRRRWLAAAALFLVISQAVRFGGGGDIHPYIQRMLDPRSAAGAIRPAQATQVIAKARRGFERTPGATAIQPPRGEESSPMLAGVAAAFLPRFIAEPLGLVHVGGGRGLWLFADLDTLVFDAVLIAAAVHCVRARRRATPLFGFVLLVLVAVGVPMIYTVSNFGTLFRLRDMLYFLAAVLPVTLAPDSPR